MRSSQKIRVGSLTIFHIARVGIHIARHHSKLDLFELLALDASPLRQSLLRLLEDLALVNVRRLLPEVRRNCNVPAS